MWHVFFKAHKIISDCYTCGSDSSPSASLKSSSAPNLRMAVSSSLLNGFELKFKKTKTQSFSVSILNKIILQNKKKHSSFLTDLTLCFLSCCPVQFDQWCPFSEWRDGPKPSSSLPSQWYPPPPFLWWPVGKYSPMKGKSRYHFLTIQQS